MGALGEGVTVLGLELELGSFSFFRRTRDGVSGQVLDFHFL